MSKLMLHVDGPLFNMRWLGLIYTSTLLILREWQRLFMEPSRMVGILMQPLLFLLVFGLGFKNSFYLDQSEVTYVKFFFPGILGLVVLFASIYATLTLVEDKKCGFFRLVMVGPGGVLGAVIGKIIATASLGFIQGLLFLPCSFLLGLKPDLKEILVTILLLLIGSICFSLIGVLFAWLSPSASAFHALMSIVLIPMWLLSGAMFPIGDGIFWWLSYLNPMAYLVAGFRIILVRVEGHLANTFYCLTGFSLIVIIALIGVIKKRPIE
jgi:ABC-2 type transport system permease protein